MKNPIFITDLHTFYSQNSTKNDTSLIINDYENSLIIDVKPTNNDDEYIITISIKVVGITFKLVEQIHVIKYVETFTKIIYPTLVIDALNVVESKLR